MTHREIKAFGKTINLTLRNDGDYAVANELFLDHQYRFCDDAIRRAKNCIIDIGGHLGFFSIMAATLNPNVPIYTFEPHIGNYELLKANLKANRIKILPNAAKSAKPFNPTANPTDPTANPANRQAGVFPKQLAVSDTIGQTELLISREDLNHSLEHAIEPTGSTQTVQTTTLERIFAKNRIDRCDLLKLDCEGSEFKIIYSTPKTVFDKIDNIFLEYHNWIPSTEFRQKQAPNTSGKTLQTFLQNLGYTVKNFPNHKMPELGFLWAKR